MFTLIHTVCVYVWLVNKVCFAMIDSIGGCIEGVYPTCSSP